MKITKTRVEAAEPGVLWDGELKGFGVKVTERGTRTYIVQRRVSGKQKRITIGRHGAYTADEARAIARRRIMEMSEGIDPGAEAQRAKIEGVTLDEVAQDYIDNRRKADGKPLAESTKADIRKHVSRAFADWKDEPIAAIDGAMVLKRYRKLEARGRAQANQAMRVLRSLYNYAIGRYRPATGRHFLEHNPVLILRETSTHRGEVAPRRTRVPVEKAGLYYRTLLKTFNDRTVSPSIQVKAAAAAVLMLTGLRKTDVIARPWSDFDLEAGTLHVPDTKHRTPRTFPLATQVVDIMKALRERAYSTDFAFPSTVPEKPIGDPRPGMRAANAEIGMHIAPHDLRRTWTDATEEDAANVSEIGCEMLCNRKGKRYQEYKVRYEHYDQLDIVKKYRKDAQRVADYFEGLSDKATKSRFELVK